MLFVLIVLVIIVVVVVVGVLGRPVVFVFVIVFVVVVVVVAVVVLSSSLLLAFVPFVALRLPGITATRTARSPAVRSGMSVPARWGVPPMLMVASLVWISGLRTSPGRLCKSAA